MFLTQVVSKRKDVMKIPQMIFLIKLIHIFENFSWRLCYRSFSQNDLNCFKNRLGTCGFADRQFFFYTSNPERFFSSLKKTIVLYLFKKFETFMVIFTSGRRRVFFKKQFFISASRTIHLTLNSQIDINWFNNFSLMLFYWP